MKQVFTLILFCFCLATTSVLTGQTLHIIAVQDDTDASLGTSVDMKHMKSFVENVAEYTNMELNSHFYTKTEFKDNPTDLGTKIRNLEVSDDDVVIFYYTGYGFDYMGSTKSFQIDGNTDSTYQIYNLDKIHSTLKAKNPHLLITMYDVSNHYNELEFPLYMTLPAENMVALQKLFLLSKGDIKISSNTAGNTNWSYTSPYLGGVFSNSFFVSFRTVSHAENTEDITWENILKKTKEKVSKETKHEEEGQQIPFFNINVEYTPRRNTIGRYIPPSDDWK